MGGTTILSPHAEQVLARLDSLLDEAYGAPESVLGNKQDPLDEAIYIILSFQTDLARFQLMWRRLQEAFPQWDSLCNTPLEKVASVLREGGLHQQKARTIKSLLRAVRDLTGALSLKSLYHMADEEAERLLVCLPGLSWKGARCVMLYSLNRNVLPIDGNTFRILKRVGIVPAGAVYRRRSLHDAIQEAVDPQRRKAFHINLVVHGQRTCLARNPKCSECIASSICAMGELAGYCRTLEREDKVIPE